MPGELESSPFELSDAEATSKTAAKIYHERMADLERENSNLRKEKVDLNEQVLKERGLRIQYGTYCRVTGPASVLLAVASSVLAGIVTIVQDRGLQIALGIAILICLGTLTRVAWFTPKGD